jgi:hypothetical protein
MAIVVKEASKTPLAIAALAKGMADSYVNWNNSEQQHQQWEQERVWTNQDRELKQSIYDELGGMGEGAFVGGRAGLLGAQNAALNGNAWDDYLLASSQGNPSAMQEKFNMAYNFFVAQGASPDVATQRARAHASGLISTSKDDIGMDTLLKINANAIGGGQVNLGTTDGKTYTDLTPQSQGKSYASEAEFHAAAEADGIKPGDVVIIAGQKMTVN